MGERATLGEVVGELRDFARRVSGRLGLRSMVVFGSYARGTQLRESDVDVLIVAEAFEGLPFYEREYMVLKLYKGSLPLEPWCYTPREVLEALERRPRIDLADALTRGVVVYDDGFWSMIRGKYLGRIEWTDYGGLKLTR